MTHGKLVRELRLPRVLRRMRVAFTGRCVARLQQQHLRDGMPQLAVFAFDHIGQTIAMWGRYERDELDLLMRAVAPHLALGGVCLDIGANIGNHAVFFADHFAEVLAFEPNPRTFSLLQLNAGLRNNIRCFNFGLSCADARASLHVPTDNIGMASLHGSGGLQVDCDLRRLDGLGVLDGPIKRHVSLIKIDVEGHESDVLAGAGDLLAQDRPVVVFEQTASEINHGSSPTIERLRAANYQNFWTIEHLPASGSRWLNGVQRLLLGERLRMVECQHFEKRFHSMIVALPTAA
jgi:FkbM family methyltransferase